MEPFEPCELRLVSEVTATSAADALFLIIGGPVPENKLWTVIGVGYRPSVAETQVISFHKINRLGTWFYQLLNPVSMNLNPSYGGCTSEGMTFMMLPGESLYVRRVAATGGSTMTARMQYVESDLPLYEYIEPQLRKRINRAATNIREAVSRGGGGGGGGGVGGTRGGRGTPPMR